MLVVVLYFWRITILNHLQREPAELENLDPASTRASATPEPKSYTQWGVGRQTMFINQYLHVTLKNNTKKHQKRPSETRPNFEQPCVSEVHWVIYWHFE